MTGSYEPAMPINNSHDDPDFPYFPKVAKVYKNVR